MWSDCSRVYSNKAVAYETGDIVTLHGKIYQLTKPLTGAYQCDNDYWEPCIEDPDDVFTPRTYSVGTIIDTVGEQHFQLGSSHIVYDCSPSFRFRNASPLDDPAWNRVTVNASPDTPAGKEFWEELPLPIDDLRLSPSSKFSSAGLLDVIR